MRKIKDSDIYLIDDKGIVYSRYKRGTRKVLTSSLYQLKYSMCGSGYPIVHLYENGKRKTAMVHRLVAEAFIENDLGLKEVNHKDGNKLNFSKDNLEWVTPSQNQKHAVRTGLKNKPPRKAMLTDEQVLTIRTVNDKNQDKVFAGLYGLDKSSICRVRLRQNYRNLP